MDMLATQHLAKMANSSGRKNFLMQNIKRICAGIVLYMLCSNLIAQDAPKQWTLEECINYAIANNINLKQAALDEQSKKIDLNTRRLSWLPSLNGNVSQNFGFGRSQSREGTIVDQNSSNLGMSVQSSMPIFTGFRIVNSIAAAKLDLKAATEALNRAKEDLSVGVASYYLQVLLSKELFNIADNQVKLTEEQVGVTEALVEAGKVAMSQLYDIKAQLANDEAQRTTAENNYNLALLDLIQVLELERLAADFDVVEPESSDAVAENMESILPPDMIYDNAVVFKPQIKEQEYLLESRKKNLRVARSDLYPQINVNANYSNGYYREFGTKGVVNIPFEDQLKNNASRGVGVSMSIPIFNRFSYRNNVRQAKVAVLNQTLMVEDSKKTLYKEIQKAYFNATAALEQYIASDKSVVASSEAFSYAEESYSAGKSSVFEYNEAKTKYTNSLSQQAQAKYTYIFSTKILDFYNGTPIKL
ncbi:MAG: TolC family protein [Tannerella sp.]|jgi:outer membrane protein|nr:TolC family protein [Tannerella sp.]